MGRRVASLCACAALLAGCGGTKEKAGQPGPHYVRGLTIKCLKRHDYTVSTKEKDVNFIAFTSVGGGLRTWKPKQHRKIDVIMAFGANGLDARQTLIGIKKIAPRGSLFTYRIRKSNVVVLFAYRPSRGQKDEIYACLKASPKRTTTAGVQSSP